MAVDRPDPTEEADIKRLFLSLLCAGLIATMWAAPVGAAGPAQGLRADGPDLSDPIFTTPLPTAAQGCNTRPGLPGMAPAMAATGVNAGTAAEPKPYDVYFNSREIRNKVSDPASTPWEWATTWAQLICGAAPNSRIDVSFFFIRAVHNSWIPESDSEVIFRALEWVNKHRNVDVTLILEGQNACLNEYLSDCFPPLPDVFRTRIEERWIGPDRNNPIIGDVKYCYQGCFNRAPTGQYAYAINHEKFLAISNTIWDGKPLVLSSSGNWSRSQIREYHEELSVTYGDVKMWQEFDWRARAMKSCAADGDNCAYLKSGPNPQNLQMSTSGRYPYIWYDAVLRRPTDAGRGTSVTFSPQIATSDESNIYLVQLRSANCRIHPQVRIAMFKMSEQKALEFVAVLKQLKGRGCDVKTMFTSEYGKTSTSPTVRKMFNDAGLWVACSTVPMHTKMVLIGNGSTDGSVMHGTQNMDVSGQYQSEEHTITYASRQASAAYRTAIGEVYAKYHAAWNEMSIGASQSRC